MVYVKCTNKFYKGNVIVGYEITDLNGRTLKVESEQLKRAIAENKIVVSNLTLTSDGRLVSKQTDKIDKSLINYLSKNNVKIMSDKEIDDLIDKLRNKPYIQLVRPTATERGCKVYDVHTTIDNIAAGKPRSGNYLVCNITIIPTKRLAILGYNRDKDEDGEYTIGIDAIVKANISDIETEMYNLSIYDKHSKLEEDFIVVYKGMLYTFKNGQYAQMVNDYFGEMMQKYRNRKIKDFPLADTSTVMDNAIISNTLEKYVYSCKSIPKYK